MDFAHSDRRVDLSHNTPATVTYWDLNLFSFLFFFSLKKANEKVRKRKKSVAAITK
jgi:hypothetical protein